MPAFDELLARHAALQGTKPPLDPEAHRPRLRLVLITCMDARIDPVRIFDLRHGDVHVLRNAGGLVTDDVIRSLILSQRLLGTNEVVILQHTSCGLHRFRDAELHGRITAETGEEPPFAFGGFEDVDDSVREGMERIRTSSWLPRHQMVRGFVYDVETATVREVEEASVRETEDT